MQSTLRINKKKRRKLTHREKIFVNGNDLLKCKIRVFLRLESLIDLVLSMMSDAEKKVYGRMARKAGTEMHICPISPKLKLEAISKLGFRSYLDFYGITSAERFCAAKLAIEDGHSNDMFRYLLKTYKTLKRSFRSFYFHASEHGNLCALQILENFSDGDVGYKNDNEKTRWYTFGEEAFLLAVGSGKPEVVEFINHKNEVRNRIRWYICSRAAQHLVIKRDLKMIQLFVQRKWFGYPLMNFKTVQNMLQFEIESPNREGSEILEYLVGLECLYSNGTLGILKEQIIYTATVKDSLRTLKIMSERNFGNTENRKGYVVLAVISNSPQCFEFHIRTLRREDTNLQMSTRDVDLITRNLAKKPECQKKFIELVFQMCPVDLNILLDHAVFYSNRHMVIYGLEKIKEIEAHQNENRKEEVSALRRRLVKNATQNGEKFFRWVVEKHFQITNKKLQIM